MKIRNGFVSNSSSSSFLVAFDRTPESAEDLHDMMFPTECCVQECEGAVMDSHEIAQAVYDRIKINKTKFNPLQKHELYEFIEDGWSFYKATDKEKKEKVAEKWELFKDKICMKMTLSDNDGNVDAFLEHNDIFRNLPHTIESHH